MTDIPTHIAYNLSVQTHDEEMVLFLQTHVKREELAQMFEETGGIAGVQITETLTLQQALTLFIVWLDECNDVTRIRVFLALRERYPNYFD